MIELTDVQFAYEPASTDDFSLQIASLSLPDQSRTALVGPSGAGKSTLLHLIAGILIPQQGQVTVADQMISAMHDAGRRKFRRSSVGLVFQTIELLDYLSLLDNVLLPYRLSGELTPAAIDRAAQLVSRVGLSDKLDRDVSQLSQGERQRVAICRAMAGAPKVLLADEPTSALDEQTAKAAMDLVFELAEEHSTTLLVLTHDRSLLPRFDRIVHVEDGQVRTEAGA